MYEVRGKTSFWFCLFTIPTYKNLSFFSFSWNYDVEYEVQYVEYDTYYHQQPARGRLSTAGCVQFSQTTFLRHEHKKELHHTAHLGSAQEAECGSNDCCQKAPR
jgi:hypothetical protein